MRTAKLEDMVRGWFVGNFSPTVYSTKNAEVAVKAYKAGDKEEAHYHKIATEITLVESGEIIMFGKKWKAGDIIVAEPMDATAFEAITDAVNVVVKIPGATDDKYLV